MIKLRDYHNFTKALYVYTTLFFCMHQKKKIVYITTDDNTLYECYVNVVAL